VRYVDHPTIRSQVGLAAARVARNVSGKASRGVTTRTGLQWSVASYGTCGVTVMIGYQLQKCTDNSTSHVVHVYCETVQSAMTGKHACLWRNQIIICHTYSFITMVYQQLVAKLIL
jgi:hypothetical protein